MMQVFTGIICDFARTADCPPPPGNWRLLQGVVYLDVRIAVGLRKRYALPGHTSVACYAKNLHPEFTRCESFFWLQKHHLTVFKLVPISFCFISKPPFFWGDATVGAQVARGPTRKSRISFRLRWGCFIAGMSFACLEPAHHAHHVWVRQTKRVTSWMIRTRGIAPGENCGTSQ